MKEIFPKLLGNKAIKELAGADILRGRCSHAYIIDGAPGSGRHTAALAVAAAVLCRAKDDPSLPLPCGKCDSCKKLNQGYNTCVTFINRGDAASLQVEVIRNMLSDTGYLPEDGDRKFYIIEEAEKMTPAAQNALLLTLEEPPPHVVFILLTADSSALLETVRSRAHIMRTELFTPAFIYDFLLKKLGEGEALSRDTVALKSAAAESGGSIGTALSLARPGGDSDTALLRQTAQELLSRLLVSGSAQALLFARDMKLTREQTGEVLRRAMSAVRDLISVKSGFDEMLFYTDKDEAIKQSAKTSVSRLYAVYSALASAENDIVLRNASVTTVLGALAAQ